MSLDASPSPTLSIGRGLERIRLEHRARRLALAVAALQRLQERGSAEQPRSAPVPDDGVEEV